MPLVHRYTRSSKFVDCACGSLCHPLPVQFFPLVLLLEKNTISEFWKEHIKWVGVSHAVIHQGLACFVCLSSK